MKTPVEKTVPFSTRVDLKAVGINTTNVLYVQAAYPRIGLTMSSIDSGNIFQLAAAVNVYSGIGNTSTLNIDPIMKEMAMAQVRNTISTEDGQYMSSCEGIFTAGDMHRGQSLVVWAIAEGLACAREVDAWMMGYTNLI